MNQGSIEQVGTPDDVYDRPATPFVYGFLGSREPFHGPVEGGWLRGGERSRAADQHRRGVTARGIGLHPAARYRDRGR